jgi:hypothetical protein
MTAGTFTLGSLEAKVTNGLFLPRNVHLLAEHGAGLDTDDVAVGDLGDGLADAVDEESRI